MVLDCTTKHRTPGADARKIEMVCNDFIAALFVFLERRSVPQYLGAAARHDTRC